ncbi:MAG: alanine racemase, partial [Elusimicrobia bacterium]|nr:alanine racemase [Elusimicrobiota bacterium]
GLGAYRNGCFDLVRPGIMLYGLYPHPLMKRRIALRPVMSVKAKVLMVKKVGRGSGISYGHTFRADKDMSLAVLGIGYSDGYARHFSNKGHVLIHGQPCPVIGRVTMDQTMVDITRAGQVKAGDVAVVMGEEKGASISCDELAGWEGTINYEIVCRFGAMLSRKVV